MLTLRDSSKDTLVVLKDDCVSEMINKEAFNMVGSWKLLYSMPKLGRISRRHLTLVQ